MYIKVSGIYNQTIPQNNENYAMEYIILSCDTSAGPVTINLKPLSAFSGFQNTKIMVIDRTGQGAANNITVNASVGDFINAAAAFVIDTNYGSALLTIADTDTWQALTPDPKGGGTDLGFHSVTYAQLTALIGAATLVQGDFYLLNDFQTRYIIPNTAVPDLGVLEPLILQASAVDKVYENAISTLFPQDEITYEVVDSTTAGGDKGRISFRKDTVNQNSTYYDWRNVKFRRWETAPASGQFTVVSDNGGAFNDYYTFNNSATAAGCKYNSLGPITPFNPKGITDGLNNTVFQCTAMSNSFDINCAQNTFWALPFFLPPCLFNRVGQNFSGNVIGAGLGTIIFFKNSIGDNFADNTIGYNFAFNIIGNVFSSNQIGNLFQSNTTFVEFSSNTIGNNFQYNKCGNTFDFNVINNFCLNNVFGDAFQSNAIADNFNNNEFGGFANGNTIADDFQRNVIGYGFQTNASIAGNFQDNIIGTNFLGNPLIGTNFSGNIIGTNFQINTIGTDFTYNQIGNNFGNNTLDNNFSQNIIAGQFQLNAIGTNFQQNEIGYGFQNNTIGNTAQENKIGQNAISNVIGDTFQKNVILSVFQTNAIGAACLYNNIADFCQNNTINDDFQANVIQRGFALNTITDIFKDNVIGSNFANNIVNPALHATAFQNNRICNNFTPAGVDFSAATLVYNAYDKEIYQNSAGTFRLRYTDNADVIQYAAPTA